MSASSSKLSYLQKYLSSGDTIKGENGEVVGAKKKSKKKRKDKVRNFKIVDGLGGDRDADEEELDRGYKDKGVRPTLKVKEVTDEEEDELSVHRTLEDRPQIAGFVDERPEIVIMKERMFTTSTFKAVVKSEDEEEEEEERNRKKKKEPVKNILPDFKIKEEPPDEDSDEEPSRRRRHDSSDGGDNSPPRRRARHDSSDEDSPPRRRRHDSPEDNSPPRRKRHDSSDVSPPRKKGSGAARQRRDSSEDNSPPRRRRRQASDSDQSPPRLKQELKREVDSDGDLSPPRAGKARTTLDGKKAGLQRASDLKEEMAEFKRKEKERFEKLDASVSGRFAETKVRGRLRDKEKEEREKKEKNEKEMAEAKKKYSRWNKGVKQTEQIQERIEEAMQEMDKPLARAADDVDLESHLKKVEREEDPMIEYFRKKRTKKAGKKKLPTYQGPMPAPNRFKIAPGYRWDGVDRSTGFEKRYFARINTRKVTEADAYAWSTEDM